MSSFHLNRDTILPSFFPNPQSAEERLFHSLAVVRAIRVYLRMSAQMRKTDDLFILPEGPKIGQAASNAASDGFYDGIPPKLGLHTHSRTKVL